MRYVEPFTQRGSLANLELAEPIEMGCGPASSANQSMQEESKIEEMVIPQLTGTFGAKKDIKIWRFELGSGFPSKATENEIFEAADLNHGLDYDPIKLELIQPTQ